MKKTMKISELTGSALDYAVDRAVNGTKYSEQLSFIRASGDGFRPSSSWKICGPLLDKHHVELVVNIDGSNWWANRPNGRGKGNGPSPLIAICRAIASMAGDEIDIPFDLLKSKGDAK